MKNNKLLAAFVARVRRRKAVVGVLGLGYVGLPLALRFAQAGMPVIGFDIDAEKIRKLRAGKLHQLYP